MQSPNRALPPSSSSICRVAGGPSRRTREGGLGSCLPGPPVSFPEYGRHRVGGGPTGRRLALVLSGPTFYLATWDPNVTHPSARYEYVWRRDERYLVLVLQLEFPRIRDYRRGRHVNLPKWLQDMEVPMGFPAMLLRFLAYYSSQVQPHEEGHNLYVILATQWVIEVASV